MFCCDSAIRIGCSSRQETHQDAHTLSSQTFPFMSCDENCLAGLYNWGSVNAGAGLFISGEGISCGFSPNPMYRNAANTTKATNGQKRIMMRRLVLPYAYRLADCLRL